MFGVGPTELAVVLMFLAGFGLPLGVPPAPENPAMQHVAPEECVLYATWTGMATPDPKSPNHTEQLLAEPEVQAFARSLEKSIGAALEQLAKESDDAKAQRIARLGPLWARTITTRSAAAFVTSVEATPEKLTFEGGLLLDAGDQSAAIVDGLVELISSEEHEAKPVTIGKLKFHRFAPKEEGLIQTQVTVGAAGTYVLVGIGEGSVEGMIERLRLKQTPEWLTALQKRLPVERRSSMSFINTPALVEAFLPMAGPDGERIAESLGLKQVGALQSVTGLDKEGMISRSFLEIDGEPRGLLTLLDGKGIQVEKLGFVPKDATIASAFSLNTQRVYNVATQLIAENAPEGAAEIERFESQFEEQFGSRLSEDVLASLGDVWTVWMSPADGWLGVTANVEVRDRKKLTALQNRIQGMLEDGQGNAPRIDTSKFGEHEISMLAMRGMPIRPSWTITESRLIVGLSPQAVKTSLSLRPEEAGLFQGKLLASAFEGEGETIAVTYQDSAKLFEATYSYLTLIVPMVIESMNESSRRGGKGDLVPFDIAAIPSSRSIHRHLQPGITVARRTKDGLETESRRTFPTMNVGTSGPVLVALMLPAVQASREAARRMQSTNNLKNIVLAMHNHHDTYKSLPPAHSLSKDGKPLLSWRVHILPFIEQQALYEQFHLDEPWDSEHNKKLIAQMPSVYQSPKSTAGPGKTTYLAISGKNGMFAPPTEATDGHTGGVGFADVRDGLSNTLMVVEVNSEAAVTWTKPDDYVPNKDNPKKGLLGVYPGGFLGGFGDGRVQFIAEAIDPAMLMRVFERNDGQIVDLE